MGFFSKLFGQNISAELQSQVELALQTVIEEKTNQNLMELKALRFIEFKKEVLTLEIQLPFPCKLLWPSLEQNISEALSKIDNINQVECIFSTNVVAHDTQNNLNPLPNIKNIIAVASGKGGVGKSTTAVNLALAMQQEGAKVGILDADIYGPSLPTMLNIKEKPKTSDGKSMEPLSAYGLQAMSIGALIEEDSPMIWRGPIVTQTLNQLLKETNWIDLDYLVIDLPPGTGDVQLTLAQQIPVTGAVIVTTPQQVSLIDAKKCLKMFEKVQIPVLGLIENMSSHVCSNCGHEEAIFGEGGGQKMADEYHIQLLGKLPLQSRIRQEADQGCPTVIAEPTSDIALKYRNMAMDITAQIALQRRNYSNAFPKIEIQNT
jgi:ATP-binding protein involved in chromosome partitioning